MQNGTVLKRFFVKKGREFMWNTDSREIFAVIMTL